MLTVQEAIDAVVRETRPLDPVPVDLADALGLVIAEDAVSDVDSPPFDKSLMDGFAVRAADLADGSARLKIIEQITAGMTPTKTVLAGCATRVMTGAPLPNGADAVVRSEETRADPAEAIVEIRTQPVASGQNVIQRGTSLKAGRRVLSAGRLLRPQELGALAEIGKHRVLVRPRATVAVLATGDELVEIAAVPGPGQIRNSNEIMLSAQVRRAGGIPRPLGIARDERTQLRERMAAGLGCDVLLLSGGVSEGTHDLVPSELAALGIRKVFHKVDLRPGKPLWFGVLERPAAFAVRDADPSAPGEARTYVFGLPGNPVSSLVCFELFVRSCLRRLMGIEPAEPQRIKARLAAEHVARGERPTYNPARLTRDAGGLGVRLVPWHGSSDLQATVDADAMAVFPGGDAMYAAGVVVDVIAWDSASDCRMPTEGRVEWRPTQ